MGGEGGARSQGYSYSGSNDLDAVAWYNGNSSYETKAVGTKQANELGIHDMSGNVWEWCWDLYGVPSPWTQVSSRLIRGGSIHDLAYRCRVDQNSALFASPETRSGSSIGFRVVRSSGN